MWIANVEEEITQEVGGGDPQSGCGAGGLPWIPWIPWPFSQHYERHSHAAFPRNAG